MTDNYYTAPQVVYAPNPMRNGLGITALVFGIITLFFAPVTLFFMWTVFVGVFAFGVPAAGLPIAVYGIKRADAGVASNRGVAVAAVVLNTVGLAWAVAVVILYASSLFAGAAS